MTPHRQETSMPPGPLHQPVRFYKVVALTFLGLTIILLGLVVFMSTKRATITIMTKATAVDVNTTVDIGPEDSNASIKGMVTTTIISLDQTFQVSGETEEPSIATGIALLKNDGSSPQPLVKTTRLLSEDNVLFRLKNAVTVPANGSVEAEIYADVVGKTGNIGPSKFIIPGLNDARQKEVYAITEEEIENGIRTVGTLSEEDIKISEKILLEKLEEKGKEKLETSVEGEYSNLFYVVGSTINAKEKVGDEVNGLNLSGTATVLGIFYKQEELEEISKKKLSTKAADSTEIVEPGKEETTITFEEYDKSTQVATVNVFSSGNAILNPESDKLQKSVFFGKTKDEVRRYLLTLDHVNGVEVKLKPAWVRHVPHVADHVRVVVQNIQ